MSRGESGAFVGVEDWALALMGGPDANRPSRWDENGRSLTDIRFGAVKAFNLLVLATPSIDQPRAWGLGSCTTAPSSCCLFCTSAGVGETGFLASCRD